MDTIIELEMVLTRLNGRPQRDADAGDLKIARRLLGIVKRETKAARDERQQVAAENLKLQARIKSMEHELALLKRSGTGAPVIEDEFVEHLGAVFVRKRSGRILDAPHCRECRKPLKVVAADVPYACPECRIFALFRPSELNDVLLTLRR